MIPAGKYTIPNGASGIWQLGRNDGEKNEKKTVDQYIFGVPPDQ